MALLQGKVIAVTGAASGIGRATAHLLASRGATLSLADVQETQLKEAASDIEKANPHNVVKVLTHIVNTADAKAVEAWLDATVKEFGHLDGAANLAGVRGTTGEVEMTEVTDEDWAFTIGVNLTGVFNCMRAELKVMSEGASVVNAASIAGKIGLPMSAPYVASKVCGFNFSRGIQEKVGGGEWASDRPLLHHAMTG